MKSTRPRKLGVFLLEGINSFATTYYFNYLLFDLRDRFGFGNLQNLGTTVLFGFIYGICSWWAGRFAQRHGYFTSLRIGFGGMFGAMLLGGLWSSVAGQLVALSAWSCAVCFTWPVLEALACEHEPPEVIPDRLGLYNVVWAGMGALAAFGGGAIFETLGRHSVYWLPAICFLGMLVATQTLERQHAAWTAHAPPAADGEVPHTDAVRPTWFRTLAWIANPCAYMAMNTIVAMVPGIAKNLGLGIAAAGALLSIWQVARAVVFAVLWRWPGWHYRFGWFAGAYGLLVASFVTCMVAREAWQLVAAQLAFGWATGLIYYSSLFYAMDASDTKGAHGGIHEAFIGAGICGGPALSAAALLLTRQPASPAWAVGAVLAAGFGVVLWVRARNTSAATPAHKA